MHIIVAFAILSGFATLAFRAIISRRPFRVKGSWPQTIVSTILGWILWIILTILARSFVLSSSINGNDILCGILILLCASWCNYWISNLAGGFRIQMQVNLASQPHPVSLEEWMMAFGELGMDTFLKDRLNSILLPWKILALEDDNVRLLPGWGFFWGRLIAFLKFFLPNVRK